MESFNLRTFNWDRAEAALSKFLGDRVIRIDDNGKQALICSDEKVLAILKIYDAEKVASLHLRASIYPNMAGYISAIIGATLPITIDEVFEYDYNGEMLVGSEALEFVSNNIKDLWFGFKEKKTGSKYDRPKLLN